MSSAGAHCDPRLEPPPGAKCADRACAISRAHTLRPRSERPGADAPVTCGVPKRSGTVRAEAVAQGDPPYSATLALYKKVHRGF